jgi:hypothetical protein
MRLRTVPLAAALVSGAACSPAGAGGGGPLRVSKIHGPVRLLPLDNEATHGVTVPAQRGDWKGYEVKWSRLRSHRWRRAAPGYLGGTMLLKTGPHSWAHIGAGICVDPNSTVRIESYADYGIRVIRGRVSAADGKPGPRLFPEYRSDDPGDGIVRR